MRKFARFSTFALVTTGVLLGVYGVLLLAGAGGENGRRADSVEFGGRHVGTPTAGAVAFVLGVVAAAAVLRRRLR